jgi:multidrug efflux pump subunit AcrA (membrane-fusion protein)
LIGAAAVIAIGGSGIWMLSRPSAASAQTTTAEATTGTFETTVTGSGTIEPRRQADLDFTVSGRVTAVKVEAGDTVAKGDALATLDTASLDAALASAQAQLDAAETTAASDGSESSVQQASNNASVASAQASVDDAEDSVDAATLRATFAGVVADVTVEVGDQVGNGSSSSASAGGTEATGGSTTTTTTSTAAVTVITSTSFVVEADVAADDIEQVAKDLQVTVTPSGATDDVYGTVSEVGRVAEADSSGAATFPVTVKITGEQKDLYPGTSADVSIVVKQEQNVLTVPTAALTSEDGTTYVDKVDGSDVTRTKVEVGQTYGTATEITSGLSDGDEVQVTTTARRPSGAGGGNDEGGQGAPPGDFGGGQVPGGAPQGGFGGNQ